MIIMPIFAPLFVKVVDDTIIDTAPESADSSGHIGQHAIDEAYFYKCVAPNEWKRLSLSALSTWE